MDAPSPDETPDAEIDGAVADIDAWLWRRRDDAGISRTRDAETRAAFSAAVAFPID